MSLLASATSLATEPFDTLRTVPPTGVAALVALFVLGAVVSFVKKLIFLGLLVAVVGGLYLAYRAGSFDGVLSGVLDKVSTRS